MVKVWIAAVLCTASVSASAFAHAETFVIQGERSGRDATLKIPVGAITQLSADFAESVGGSIDTQVESMRLSGDVLISIAGSTQPIQIKADSVVLELTPDLVQSPLKHSRAEAASTKLLRSTTTLPGDHDSQIFLGNVVFDLQTASGPMEIKADRVEHQLQPNEAQPKAGA